MASTLQDKIKYANGGDGSTTGYFALPVWQASHDYSAVICQPGGLVRPVSPTLGNERVWLAYASTGNSGGSEPSWSTVEAAKQTGDGGVNWIEVTGRPSVNGDLTNTVVWTSASTIWTVGQIVYEPASATLQICTTGSTGNTTATFSTTPGVVTNQNAVVWVSLGLASGWTSSAKWKAPFPRLASALSTTFTRISGGDIFYVAKAHTETQAAAISVTPYGVALTSVISVDQTGSVPPASADVQKGAQVSTTGNNAMTLSTVSGGAIFYQGIKFSVGADNPASAPALNPQGNFYRDCDFYLGGSTGGVFQGASNGSSSGVYDNCTVQWNSTAGLICGGLYADLRWRGGSIVGSVIPATLMTATNGLVSFEGADLSLVTGTLFSTTSGRIKGIVKDCKLSSGVGILASPRWPAAEADITVIRSDNGATNYRSEFWSGLGTQIIETTVVRTGGASDGNTAISWKMTPNTNANFQVPFRSLPMAKWNDTVGTPVTVTVYGIWGGASPPTTGDVWLDVEYPGSTLTPQGSIISSGKANSVAANGAGTADGSTWGGSTTAFKMSVTVTPQMKGPITVRVKSAYNATTTFFYIDPELALS